MAGRFMDEPRRSPIHLTWRHDPILLSCARHQEMLLSEVPKWTEWKLRAPVRAARFRAVRRPEWWAVLHPSTKEPGRWQVSKFDERGPWGDVCRDTPERAIEDGLDGLGLWKLESVVDEHGRVYGKEV